MPKIKSGLWIDPTGASHPVDSHSAFARDVLEKSIISDAESKKLTLGDDGESLEWKGTGGAEAKGKAQSDLSGRTTEDPQNSTDLRNLGWVQVRISGDQVTVLANRPDSIANAWSTLGGLMAQYGSISFGIGDTAEHSSAVVTAEELGDSSGGDAIVGILRSRASVNKGGLGMWLRR
jgi:hypothetical protein